MTTSVVTDFFDALADHLADKVAEKIKGPQSTAAGGKPVATLEAAAALGVSGRSLIRWEAQGCPSIKTAGGKRRWDVVAVKSWLDARDGAQ